MKCECIKQLPIKKINRKVKNNKINKSVHQRPQFRFRYVFVHHFTHYLTPCNFQINNVRLYMYISKYKRYKNNKYIQLFMKLNKTRNYADFFLNCLMLIFYFLELKCNFKKRLCPSFQDFSLSCVCIYISIAKCLLFSIILYDCENFFNCIFIQ